MKLLEGKNSRITPNWAIWVIVTLFLGSILALMAFPRNGIATWHCVGDTQLNVTASLAQEKFGGCDGGSILRIALDFNNGGKLEDSTINSLNLWPPGMAFIELTLFKLFGVGIGIGTAIASLISISLLLSFVFFISVLARLKFFLPAVISSFLLLVSTPIRGWVLGTGLMYQEGFALCCVIVAMTAIIWIDVDSRTQKLGFVRAIVAGIGLGGAAYFRAIFEPIISILIVVSMLSILAILAVNRNVEKFRRSTLRVSFLQVAVISLVAFCVMLPWRAALVTNIHPGDSSWTKVGSNIWGSRWLSSSSLDKMGLSPWQEGGLNAPCVIDKELCKQIAQKELNSTAPYSGSGYYSQEQFRKMVIRTYLKHPIATLRYKAEVFYRFWTVNNFENYLGHKALLEGWSYLLAFAVSVAFSILRFRQLPISSSLWIVQVFATLGILMIYHLEARYLIFLKVGAVLIINAHVASIIASRRHLKKNELS